VGRHRRWMAQWRDADCASVRATGEGGQCVLQTSDGCGERDGGVYGGAMIVVRGRWWLSGHLHSRPSLSTRRSLAPTTTSVWNMGSGQHSYPLPITRKPRKRIVHTNAVPPYMIWPRRYTARARTVQSRFGGRGMMCPRRRVCPTPLLLRYRKKKRGVSIQCLGGHT
jgi:hypothetical protein